MRLRRRRFGGGGRWRGRVWSSAGLEPRRGASRSIDRGAGTSAGSPAGFAAPGRPPRRPIRTSTHGHSSPPRSHSNMSAAHLQAWLPAFPIANGIHVFEEFAWPGGLIRWIDTYNHHRLKRTRYYVVLNGAAILGASLIAAFACNVAGYRLYLYSVELLAGNALTHLRGSPAAEVLPGQGDGRGAARPARDRQRVGLRRGRRGRDAVRGRGCCRGTGRGCTSLSRRRSPVPRELFLSLRLRAGGAAAIHHAHETTHRCNYSPARRARAARLLGLAAGARHAGARRLRDPGARQPLGN